VEVESSMSNRLSRRNVLVAIILSGLGAAVTGIIGGRSDFLFVWLWEQSIVFIPSHTWFLLIISAFLLILALCVIGYIWRRYEILSRGLDTLKHLVELDDSLLRLLPDLMSAKDRESEMKRLLEELLQDMTRAFAGNVHRASILLPDATKEYLRVWVHYQMPEVSVEQTKFYIGKDADRKRGVAGEVFLAGRLRVVHIDIDREGNWCADSKDYMVFNPKRPYPPYRSFINVPFGSKEDSATCLGVVCFDSESPRVFDSPEIQDMLLMLGRRIAVALLIYQQFPPLRKEGKHPGSNQKP
jgi:hypothetical protein